MVSRFNDLAAWLNDSYHRLHSYHNNLHLGKEGGRKAQEAVLYYCM